MTFDPSVDHPCVVIDIDTGKMLARAGDLTLDIHQATITTPRLLDALGMDRTRWVTQSVKISTR